MLTIADIYDALTAKDRPYKAAVPLDKALDILESEVKQGKLDGVLYKLFVQARVYQLPTRSGAAGSTKKSGKAA
jgi:HD-GYP domain-containing protein (c-di-GMP phosphodiesterase class II)